MPMTTNNIWYPDDTAPVAPLEGLFSALATSVDVQVASVNVNNFPAVADQAGRLALFPVNVKGARVWRKDLGYAEVYYDSTGTTAPGWYPMPGSDVGFSVTRATTDTWSANTRTPILGGSAVLPAGKYQVESVMYLAAPAGAGNAYMSVNGADVTTPPCDGASGIRDSHQMKAEYNHAGAAFNVSIDQLFLGSGSKTVYTGSTIKVRYLGPRK